MSASRCGQQPVSVTQDGDPIRDPVHLVHPVRDVDDRDAPGLQPVDQLEQRLGLVPGEAGRRLVHDQHLGVLGQRLGDLGELPVGGAQLTDPGPRIDLDVHVGEHLPRLADRLPVVDQTSGHRFGGQIDVLRDGQAGHQAELLEDHPDACRLGRVDRGQIHLPAIDHDLPGVLGVDALQDLHQGRLAGSVAAGEGMDLPAGDLEVDALQDDDAVEALLDADHLDRQFGR